MIWRGILSADEKKQIAVWEERNWGTISARTYVDCYGSWDRDPILRDTAVRERHGE